MTWLEYTSLALCLCALVVGVAQSLRKWELLRYTRQMLSRENRAENNVPAALIVPCKGRETGLEENLRAIFEQDHPSYEIVFVVEDEDDPATAVIEQLRAAYPHVPSRLVVAGVAARHGQKIHNLLAATDALPRHVQVLAFADSDIRPARTWLRSLVYHMGGRGMYVRTGYRWLVPERGTLPNILVAAINNCMATYFGRRRFNLAWGGTWAIWRPAFEGTALREAWQGTLADDLVATRTVSKSGLAIHFEPRCMTPSPIDYTWAQAWEFLRRQCLLVKTYLYVRWLLTLAGCLLWHFALWSNAILAVVCLTAERSDANEGGNLAGAAIHGAASLSLYLLGSLRAWIGQCSYRARFGHLRAQLSAANRAALWLHPLCGILFSAAMVSSIVGRSICWRGIWYHMGPGGQILLMGRIWKPGTAEASQSDSTRADGASEGNRGPAIVPMPHLRSRTARRA